MRNLPESLRRPVLLQPDNFTPLSRTPWASDKLARTCKRTVVGVTAQPLLIGEAWEFSCDPQFPSQLRQAVLGPGDNVLKTLPALVAAFPEAILSPRLVAQHGAACEVLVKLLSPREPLSLQVHPADDDAVLKQNECGKPESWLILSASPGAGIYLGFSRAIAAAELAALLADPGHTAQVQELLQFVPVHPGDYFEIGPGVPHAIGGDLILLEPQRVRFGLSGKTLRLWDWGRKYNAAGHLDPFCGQARPLHIEEGLRLIDPPGQVGETFVSSLRRPPQTQDLGNGLLVQSFPANDSYQTLWIEAARPTVAELNVDGGYGALVVISGSLLARDVRLDMGQPALLPHAAMPLRLEFKEATKMALVIPSGSTCQFVSLI